jgi:very-short-patch-repair endonuclease
MTPHEIRLWAHLRLLKAQGYHFRRQVPIDGYVVDFACFGARLVIEVDGGQHGGDAHAARDAARDAHLEAQGFSVLRVWNSDVDSNFDGVMATIIGALET